MAFNKAGNWGAFIFAYLQWKATSTTYSESVFVALGIQYAMRMHHIFHLWPAPLCSMFPHYLANGTIFEKKIAEHKMCVLVLSTNFVRHISHSKKIWERYDQKLIFM
jgi:hypothetical protein